MNCLKKDIFRGLLDNWKYIIDISFFDKNNSYL